MSDKTTGDIANRVGLWVAILGILAYVISIGQWVGAADEKFNDAETVEHKQEELLLQANTMAVEQQHLKEAVEENKEAIEESKKEILAAIAAVHKDD